MLKSFIKRDLSKLKIPFVIVAISQAIINVVLFFLVQFSVFENVKVPMLITEISSRAVMLFVFLTTVIYLALRILRKYHVTDLSAIEKNKLALIRIGEVAVIGFIFCFLSLVETTIVDAAILDRYGYLREIADTSFVCFSAVGKGAFYWLLPMSTAVLATFTLCMIYGLKGLITALGNPVAGIFTWLLYSVIVVFALALNTHCLRYLNILYYTDALYTGIMPGNTIINALISSVFGVAQDSAFCAKFALVYDLSNLLSTFIFLIAAFLMYGVYAWTQRKVQWKIVVPAAILLLVYISTPFVMTTIWDGGSIGSIDAGTSLYVATIYEDEYYDFSEMLEIIPKNRSYEIEAETIREINSPYYQEGVEENDGTTSRNDIYISGNRIIAKSAGCYYFRLELRVMSRGAEPYFTGNVLELDLTVLPKEYKDYQSIETEAEFQYMTNGKYILKNDIEIDCSTLPIIEDERIGVYNENFSGWLVNPNGYKITLKNNDGGYALFHSLDRGALINGLIIDGGVLKNVNVGGVAGWNHGTIFNCTLFATAKATENSLFVGNNNGGLLYCQGYYYNEAGGIVKEYATKEGLDIVRGNIGNKMLQISALPYEEAPDLPEEPTDPDAGEGGA